MSPEERELRWSRLMKLAQSGDQQSYRELLDELRVVFESYLRRRPHRGIDLEDLVQNALLAVHNARHTYLPSKPFGPWVYGILKHKLLDALRVSYRNQKNFSSTELSEVNEGGETPAIELGMDALTAIGELSARQQELLLLVREEGLSMSEAAERAGTSEGAVRVMMHRTMKQLRLRLKAD